MCMSILQAEATKYGDLAGPDFELNSRDEGKVREGWKVPVVEPKTAQKLPDTLDRIELRAARRKKKAGRKRIVWRPGGMECGVLISGLALMTTTRRSPQALRRRRRRRNDQQVRVSKWPEGDPREPRRECRLVRPDFSATLA